MAPRIAPVLLGLVGLAAAVPGQELSYPDLLDRLTDPDWLLQPPRPGESCVQFSSYDRGSDGGPARATDWYANGDRGHYLGQRQRDGRTEHVMVRAEGPGYVGRIWSANPGGRLYFYFDGEAEPSWVVDFAELTSGRLGPLQEPLAGVRSRGANCHLPIPFSRSLEITSERSDFYYQVNVTRLPAGATVASFRPDDLQRHAAAIERCRRALSAPAAVPAAATPIERRGQAAKAGFLARIPLPAGSIVRSLEARLRPAADDAADSADRYRQVLVVVRCGDEELVRVPLADFFGAAPDLRPYRTHWLGVEADGRGYCRLPMPMPQAGEVALLVEGEAFAADWLLRVAVEEGADLPDEPLRFRADWHLAKAVPTRPFSDHLVLDARGSGRFAGCALMVKNPVKAWWGEGDEKFWVDGEGFPSTFGTGTEDYFGYAWCCPEPFASALHAQVQCDGPDNYGFTSLQRIQVADSVPFSASFRFDLEIWHWVPEITVDYATVAYWYGAAGARSGLPPLPPPAGRTVDRLPPYRIYRAPGAIEGEDLQVLEAGGGRHQVQDMAGFADGKWSGEKQLWWIDGAPGDELVLALPVAEAGRYRLLAAFTRADDYGTVQVLVGETAVGEPVDLYSPRVVASGEVLLGVVELPAGQVRLTLRLTGRNDKAKPRHMVGLDYLRLQKVE